MRKEHLLKLAEEIKRLAAPADILPIIVGSQVVHVITNFVPEIVRQSIECDFLFGEGAAEIRREVNLKLGIFSSFQQENGFYADALGLGTVVLPKDWEKRLQNLTDDAGETIALCTEIHDVAVSKFVAGREKDFQFLKDGFERDFINFEIFAERLQSIKEMPQSEVLQSRLESFAEFLRGQKSAKEIYVKVLEMKKVLESER